jgi:hypothetical protein
MRGEMTASYFSGYRSKVNGLSISKWEISDVAIDATKHADKIIGNLVSSWAAYRDTFKLTFEDGTEVVCRLTHSGYPTVSEFGNPAELSVLLSYTPAPMRITERIN